MMLSRGMQAPVVDSPAGAFRYGGAGSLISIHLSSEQTNRAG